MTIRGVPKLFWCRYGAYRTRYSKILYKNGLWQNMVMRSSLLRHYYNKQDGIYQVSTTHLI